MVLVMDVAVWPLGASLPKRLAIGFNALRILQYEPDHPVQGPLFEWCLDNGVQKKLAVKMRQTEVGSRLIAQRPTLQGPDLDLSALRAMPDGTLGREFARYFEKNGIQPFRTTFAIDSDDVYLAKRYRETHDLLHVITGYATHFLGEMELQAFVLGNLGLPSAAMILVFSLGIRFQVAGFREWSAYLKRLRVAYRRGARSKMMLDVEFEKRWLQPVSQVTAELCAESEPVPEITVGIHQPPKPTTA
ncbi:MAG: hypothetical protein JNM17_17315 [Archangium sp.]|nr:hypothetical protein [Archangium sp.]